MVAKQYRSFHVLLMLVLFDPSNQGKRGRHSRYHDGGSLFVRYSSVPENARLAEKLFGSCEIQLLLIAHVLRLQSNLHHSPCRHQKATLCPNPSI